MQCFVFPASSMLMPRLLLGIVQNGELRMKYSYCRASLKTLYSHGEKKHWKGEKILVPCRMYILCETNFSTPSTVLLKISLFTLEERTDHSNPITAQVWNRKFKYSNLQQLVTVNRRVEYRNYPQPVSRIRPDRTAEQSSRVIARIVLWSISNIHKQSVVICNNNNQNTIQMTHKLISCGLRWWTG